MITSVRADFLKPVLEKALKLSRISKDN